MQISGFAPPRWARTTAAVGAALLLWLALVDWPEPVTAYVDASWQAILVHAHENGRSFGNGIIFSAGPLGYLNSHYFLPDSLDAKLAWELGGRLLLTFALVGLTAGLSVGRRVLFLAAAPILLIFFADTFFFLLLILAFIQWILPRDRTPWQLFGGLLVAAFFAQLKFTYCLLAAAGVALVVIDRILRREWRQAILVFAGFIVLYLGFWLAAGQNPVRLPDYWRYSWQISAGYPWAMSFDESWPVFIAGAIIASLCGLCAWQIWRRTQGERLGALILPLMLAAGWFLSWKHGFTRGDGHVLAFFLYTFFIGIALPAFIPAESYRRWFEIFAPLSLAGIVLADSGLAVQAPRIFLQRLQASSTHLTNLSAFRAGFAAALQREKALHDFPIVRKAIANGTVDLLNCEQGFLLLHGLNYQPRPIPQGYAVYTSALLQKNAGFFRREKAPEYVVVRMGSIDNRYPAQDDSLVLAELPLRYDLRMVEGESLLFQRKAIQPPKEPFRRQFAEFERQLGEEISLPTQIDQAIWIQFDFPLSWLGQGRGLLYKPPMLNMVATDAQGDETRFRVIPTIGSTGFLIQPFLAESSHYAAFARGKGSKIVRSVRFEAASENEREFWRKGRIRLFQIPELPLQAEDPASMVVGAGISKRKPEFLRSDTTVQFVPLAKGQRVLLVHATGEVGFQIEPEIRHLSVEFGLSRGSYMDGGKTDGAEFAVDAEDASGQVKEVWRQHLDPLNNPADRELQQKSLDLPPGTRRVVLRTLPGESRNNNWDWTFWSRISFTP